MNDDKFEEWEFGDFDAFERKARGYHGNDWKIIKGLHKMCGELHDRIVRLEETLDQHGIYNDGSSL